MIAVPITEVLVAGLGWAEDRRTGKICGDSEASGSLADQSTGMSHIDAQPPAATHELADASATRALGRRLAQRLPAGALLLLHGDLGAGKTSLVQGLAEGLGIGEPITSPTFALAQHYAGQRPGGGATALVHLDLYRLEDPAAADELFSQEEEEANALGAVLAVEWPERLSLLPEPCWRVELAFAGEGRLARVWVGEGDG
jgi:tRNA threonylcarbamoyladenosine biosynthesis protein TsaE